MLSRVILGLWYGDVGNTDDGAATTNGIAIRDQDAAEGVRYRKAPLFRLAHPAGSNLPGAVC